MHFSRSYVVSALLGLAAATSHLAGEMGAASAGIAASETMASARASGAAPAATGGAGAGEVPTHVIQVGGPNGSLIFSPDNIEAKPGDLVQFQFNPKNHSVVQSTFDQPCVPIQNVMTNKTDAFFSGFMPSNATAVAAGEKLTYTIRVMDTKPIWFYCSQGMHCQGGMVGAINAAATGNKTMAAFKQLAASATENITPGQGAGSGNSGSPGSVQPSGGEGGGEGGGAGATQPVGGGASPSSADQPAQQSSNVAPGRVVSQSLFGLGLSGLAAFIAL